MKYKYMSDRDKDYECLERQLSEGLLGCLDDHVEHAKYPDRETSRPHIEVIAKSLNLEYQDAVSELYRIRELPTRYDDPYTYTILDGLVRELNDTIARLGISLLEFPLFGSVPTGKVNASARKFNCSEKKFILFDSQLFTYCNLFAKAFALSIPFGPDSDKMHSYTISIKEACNYLNENHESIVRLYDVLSALHYSGKPTHAKQYIPKRPHVRLAETFRRGMELFVVAHEFGHVYANHLGEITRRLGYLPVSIKFKESQHILENEADRIALQLTIATMNHSGLDIALSYIGIDVLFRSLMFSDRFQNYCRSGSDENYTETTSSTHPTSEQRRDSMRSLLNTSHEMFADALELASTYELVLNKMWDCILLRHKKLSKLTKLKRLQK